MWSANQRSRAVKIFLRRLGLLGLLVLVIAAGSGVWQVYGKERESAALRAQAESQQADLAARKAELQSDLSKLQTDRGKEEILRTQYALAEKGEGLIVIVDPSTTTRPATTTSVFESIRKFFWPW